MAKFRRSPAEGVAITQIRSCSKHASNSPRTQAEISGSLRGRCGRTSRPSRAGWIHWITFAKQPETRRAGSKMPARCSQRGSDAFAASTALGSTAKAGGAPERQGPDECRSCRPKQNPGAVYAEAFRRVLWRDADRPSFGAPCRQTNALPRAGLCNTSRLDVNAEKSSFMASTKTYRPQSRRVLDDVLETPCSRSLKSFREVVGF